MIIKIVKQKLTFLYWGFRIIYTLSFIGSGLDKFFYFLIDWNDHYIPFYFLPHEIMFFKIRGLIEIGIGVALCTRFVKEGAALACFWLILSALYSFLMPHHLDTVFRYLVIAWGAYALMQLSLIKQEL